MTPMILVPLDDTVVFPTMDVTLPVDVGDEDRVLLIPRHDNAFAKVGTIAAVTDSVRLPGQFHLDAADRMIVATARALDANLLTADRAILAYGEQGYVRVADAGR